MDNQIENISKVKLSREFKILIVEFEKYFGSKEKGFLKFSQYIGFDSITNKDEVRLYESVPFEAELPFPTGGNGEYMGWLNLCSEIRNYRKPFICWAPLGRYVFYHGKNEIEIIENSVKSMHGDDYKEIDLEFLEGLGIIPSNGNPIQLINFEGEVLKKAAIEIPENYRFEITKDGVGVLANEKYFSPIVNHKYQNYTIKEILQLASDAFQNEYWGTSLFFLKEGYFENYFNINERNSILDLLRMKKEVYNKLSRHEIAQKVNQEIENFEFNKAKE